MFKLKTKHLTEDVSLTNLPTLRQAFIVASLIIIAGYILGALANPWFLLLPLLVAGGLMFAGVTGFCPMVAILQAMPWNREKKEMASAEEN